MSDTTTKLTEIQRLRNRHVARTLDAIGNPDPHVVRAVKRGFSEIQQDFENILTTGSTGNASTNRRR